MLTALAWVSRGFAKHVPAEYEAKEEEKTSYAQMVKEEKECAFLS